MAKSKTRTPSDDEYAATIVAAAKTNEKMDAKVVETALRAVLTAGIRRPNSWQFDNYNRKFRLEWCGDMKAVGRAKQMVANFDDIDSVSLSGNVDGDYDYGSNNNGVTVKELNLKQGMTILKVLVELIDAKKIV